MINKTITGFLIFLFVVTLSMVDVFGVVPSSGGTATIIPTATSPSATTNTFSALWQQPPSQRSKEIDDVWQQIQGKLGLQGDSATKVWHGKWKGYDIIYSPASIVTPTSRDQLTLTKTGTIGTTKSNDEQKKCLNDKYGWYAVNNPNNQLELVPGVTPQKVELESVNVGRITHEVNKVIAEPLRKVALIIQQSGYKVHHWHSCREEDDSPRDNLFDAPRCGSLHPACLAIDINPMENQKCPAYADDSNWWGRVPSQEERDRCRKGEIVTDIPQQIIQAFEENGFYWGGRFTSSGKGTPDSMHFEYVGDCCKRTYKQLTYSLTPESSYVSNPKCLYGINQNKCELPQQAVAQNQP